MDIRKVSLSNDKTREITEDNQNDYEYFFKKNGIVYRLMKIGNIYRFLSINEDCGDMDIKETNHIFHLTPIEILSQMSDLGCDVVCVHKQQWSYTISQLFEVFKNKKTEQ